MQTKIIKCPTCGTTLEVKNSKNEDCKVIKCPTCSSQLRVRFQEQPQPSDPGTVIGGSTVSEGERTVIGGNQKFSKAFLVCDGVRYKLSEGRNIVGRKSDNSTADVQINTTDRYMSRLNTLITVNKTDQGIVVYIAKYKNVNPILVGKIELLDGDVVMIRNGESFTMGKTTIKLVLE